MHLINAEALERGGWFMCRHIQINMETMEYQTKKPTDFPAVEPQSDIIRCKDCKNYQTDWETSYPNRHYCATMDSFIPEDGFCSYAERREE